MTHTPLAQQQLHSGSGEAQRRHSGGGRGGGGGGGGGGGEADVPSCPRRGSGGPVISSACLLYAQYDSTMSGGGAKPWDPHSLPTLSSASGSLDPATMRRLRLELRELLANPLPGIVVVPDDVSVVKLHALITGAATRTATRSTSQATLESPSRRTSVPPSVPVPRVCRPRGDAVRERLLRFCARHPRGLPRVAAESAADDDRRRRRALRTKLVLGGCVAGADGRLRIVCICSLRRDHATPSSDLDNAGKVCLSILGTWAGPPWTPACSISSVLLCECRAREGAVTVGGDGM